MMVLEVLGMGCSKCNLLAERAEQAARELGLEYRIEKVSDFDRLVSFRIMSTPGFVIDGTLQFVGRVPSVRALKELLASPTRS